MIRGGYKAGLKFLLFLPFLRDLLLLNYNLRTSVDIQALLRGLALESATVERVPDPYQTSPRGGSFFPLWGVNALRPRRLCGHGEQHHCEQHRHSSCA